MELGEPEKKKKQQESEVERWARLDKRIERARTRHELTHLVMGTIFLVQIFIVQLDTLIFKSEFTIIVLGLVPHFLQYSMPILIEVRQRPSSYKPQELWTYLL